MWSHRFARLPAGLTASFIMVYRLYSWFHIRFAVLAFLAVVMLAPMLIAMCIPPWLVFVDAAVVVDVVAGAGVVLLIVVVAGVLQF